MIHFDESFVIAVCFVIFIYLSYRPVKKAILTTLDNKIEEIKSKLSQAAALKNEAENLLNEVEKQLNNFEIKKTEIIANAQESIKRHVDLKNKEINQSLARKKDSAIKAIDNEIEKASSELKSEFIDSVMQLVKAYLAQTKNNNMSDKEIIEHFIKKS